MAKFDARVRSRVFLVAFGTDGKELFRKEIAYDDYYGGATQLIDDNEFRGSLGVARVTGEIYDSKGKLQQSFENRYDELGRYSGGRAIHADGTIIEH